MQTESKIIADSIGPHGRRLTTYVVTFPRFILAEVNTHRMLSRNSASSRAIPPEKIIEQVQLQPFVPRFNARVKGMGVGEVLADQLVAREHWYQARDSTVNAARGLLKLNVDKSRVNRLLEPFMWHTAILSATDWRNFFTLRTDMAPQPEFRELAVLMKAQYDASQPQELAAGEWHTPLVPEFHGFAPEESAGKCASISYGRIPYDEPSLTSIERSEKLAGSRHWSPFEHPAVCLASDRRIGNYQGFMQLRKFYPGESGEFC